MLHHVGIEVAPGDVPRSIELWETLGFALVEPPDTLNEYTAPGGHRVELMAAAPRSV